MKEDMPLIEAKRKQAEEGAFMSDMGIDIYKQLLGINLEEMKGKLVLDIGSGIDEKFSKEAAKIGVKVVSMNPNLKYGALNKELKKKDWQKRSVAGRAQKMSFADNSFDYEVGLFSVPFYLPLEESEYKLFFDEVIRTLKPGGKAYIFPIFKNEAKGAGRVSPDFVFHILDQFSDSITYKIKEWAPKDKECRLVITKKG